MTMKKILVPVIILLLVLGWGNIIGGNASERKKYNEYMSKAKALDEKEIYIDALDQYKKALEFTKDKLPVEEAILDDYLNLKKYKEFEKQGSMILENYNYPRVITKKVIDYYMERKQSANALKVVNAYLERQPNDGDFLELQGKLGGIYTEIYFSGASIDEYYNGFYVFTNDDKKGLMKSDGSEKIKSQYDDILPYGKEPNYAAVCKDGDWYYIEKNGYKKLLPDFKVDSLGVFGNKLAPYKTGEKYSYIDEYAKKTTELTYDFAGGFANKRAAVKKEDKWAVIKNDFSQITDFIYDDVIMDDFGFATSQNVYIAKLDGKYHIFDLDGNMKGSEGFDDAKAFVSDDMAAVKMNNKWCFANKNGEVELMTEYKNAKSFSNGFAAVYDGKKWGYINKKATVVIDFGFSEAGCFNSSGVAAVKKGTWKFIKLIE